MTGCRPASELPAASVNTCLAVLELRDPHEHGHPSRDPQPAAGRCGRRQASTPPRNGPTPASVGPQPSAHPVASPPAPAPPPVPWDTDNTLNTGGKPSLTETLAVSQRSRQSARGSAEAAWLSRAAGGDGARGLPQGQVPAAADDPGDAAGQTKAKTSLKGEGHGQAVKAVTRTDFSSFQWHVPRCHTARCPASQKPSSVPGQRQRLWQDRRQSPSACPRAHAREAHKGSLGDLKA